MRDRLRPLLPAFLAVLFPGLGHFLLRRWGRALVWHATIVGGAVALYVLYDAGPVDPLPPPLEFVAAFPPAVSLPVAFLVALSAVDAYLVGREAAAAERRAEAVAAARGRVTGTGAASGDAEPHDAADEADPATSVTCPHCGRETDAEIDFCHWCTEPLPWVSDDA